MEVELELDHDAEARAAAAQGPQQLALGLHLLAAGRDDRRPGERVGGEPELALEPARAGAEREAGHADRRDPRAGDGQAVRLRRGVQLAPGGAALDEGAAAFDAHAAHRREVDDERAVVDREAVGAVAAAADADGQARLAREVERRVNVAGAPAARDHGGPAVDRVVLGAARLVVGGVVR